MISEFTSVYSDFAEGPIHVADFGGEGPPVVCVHGLGGSHANWVAVAGGLRRLGHVTAIDLPGFGLSPARRGAATMDGHRRALGDYLRSLNAPALLVANSMGGAVSILQASSAPGTVSGLVLVSPASPHAPGVWPDAEVTSLFSFYLLPGLARGAVAARRAAMTPEDIARWTLDLCSARAARIAPDVFDFHVALARRRAHLPGIDRALITTARSMLTLLARPSEYDRAVAGVLAPTLLIQGREDRLVRYQSAQRLAGIRPDWDVRILDDVGHVAMLEVPATFVEMVTTWAEHRRAA